MRKRHLVIVLGFAFFAAIVLAWFSKPEPLKVSIEKAGIHLGSTDNGHLSYPISDFYKISADDERKLKSLATDLGYSFEHLSGPDTSVDVYTKEIRFLYFWHHPQTITFDVATRGYVHIDPKVR